MRELRLRKQEREGVAEAVRVSTAGEELVLYDIERDIVLDEWRGESAIVVNGLGEFAEVLLALAYPSKASAWVEREAAAMVKEVEAAVAAKGENFEHWSSLSEEELADERAAYLTTLEYYAG